MQFLINKLKGSLWKLLLIGLAAFPILGVIEFLSGQEVTPFTNYLAFLKQASLFVYKWLDWVLITWGTLYLIKNITKIKYETQERIRERRFNLEMNRYMQTPYAPPLLLFYLTHPPVAFSPYKNDEVYNVFYQKVVNAFRDRIYINAHVNSLDPEPRSGFLKIIGYSEFTGLLALLGSLLGILMYIFIFDTPANLIFGWERFFLPVIIFVAALFIMKLQAILTTGTWYLTDQALFNYFQDPAPKITWRELFPDKRGKIVLNAWEAEREKRIRETQILMNVPYGSDYVDNTSLAPYPYPYDSLPEWLNDLDEDILKLQEKEVKIARKASSKKVIDFSTRKKHS